MIANQKIVAAINEQIGNEFGAMLQYYAIAAHFGAEALPEHSLGGTGDQSKTCLPLAACHRVDFGLVLETIEHAWRDRRGHHRLAV